MTGAPQPLTLIDELLAEQQRLTAVERFARRHDRSDLPAQARYYRDLIPLTKPAAGQQYAFEVDLDRCSGCKACVSACHSLNGLDEGEAWRETGLIFSADWREPCQQTVTTACHHCAEPGCAEGCPVLAYEKDPVTGIVRHLDDQCIGCQYCVMKCPYEVPKYSAQRGIVRKCDMCANRLAAGEAPACVQACPDQAIRITIVGRADVIARANSEPMLPTAPDSSLTKPSTRYVSARALPTNLLSGDHARVQPEAAHLPLVFMLVLTQLSVGASLVACGMASAFPLTLVAAVAAVVGLNVAALHLGKPLKAWRAFLGWRTSWFSREVIVFGAFAPLALLNASARWGPGIVPFGDALEWATAVVGLIGVVCSAMIYVDTHRPFWTAGRTFGRFLGSVWVLGNAAALMAAGLGWIDLPLMGLVVLLAVGSTIKLAFEREIFRHQADRDVPTLTSLNKTARLLTETLGLATRARFGAGLLGGVILPALFLLRPEPSLAIAAFALCLIGELLERYLFFRAVVPLKMPGGLAT